MWTDEQFAPKSVRRTRKALANMAALDLRVDDEAVNQLDFRATFCSSAACCRTFQPHAVRGNCSPFVIAPSAPGCTA
jgi:hypothetical protein